MPSRGCPPAGLVHGQRNQANATIEDLPDGGLRIRALVRNSDLAADPRVRKNYAVLSRALLAGATGQLRNKATVEIGDRDVVGPTVRTDRFHHRVERPHCYRHVRRVRGNALVAGADGKLVAIGHEAWSDNLPWDNTYESAANVTQSLYAAPNRMTAHRLHGRGFGQPGQSAAGPKRTCALAPTGSRSSAWPRPTAADANAAPADAVVS